MSRFLDPRYAALVPYTPGEQPRGRKFIKLNTNESPYPPSPKVIEAITRAEVEDLRLYSDPTASDLLGTIAEFYGLKKEQVVTGNGSDEILAFAFLAFCGQKGVVFPEISYGFYPVFAELFGVRTRPVALNADFTIDITPYLVPGENVVIANPNAPTGLALGLDQIETILRAHPDDVVLIDEAYVDFGARSAVGLLPKYDNLLIVQTYSKSRALAGGRIGFALGNAALIADLSAMKYSFNPYNLGRLPLLAGAASMRDVEYFRACTDRIIVTREKTAKALKALGCVMTDSLANFLFVRLPGVAGGRAQQRLRDKGILVRWFDRALIRDYLRVTVGSEEEMAAFVQAVEEIIREEAQ